MKRTRLWPLAILALALPAHAGERDSIQPPPIDLKPDIPTMDLDAQAPSIDDAALESDEPRHLMPDPIRACADTQEELDQVRARALEFLFARHPELDQDCERLKKGITFAVEEQVCFVEGGIIRKDACREQAKNSYIVTISVEDLEPLDVYWRRKDRFIPEYKGDLEEYSNLPRE